MAETIPSLPEARALLRLFHETGADGWISFSCRDDHSISDGTPFAEAAAQIDVPVGANCTDPAYIANLISLGARVVYPNSGETWNARKRTWEGVGNDFPRRRLDGRDPRGRLLPHDTRPRSRRSCFT